MSSFVPQEENSTLEGKKKVMYARDSDGTFARVNYGSSVEEFATMSAVDEYEFLMLEALREYKKQQASPIKYFMFKNRMDLPTLCSIVGMFCFRVKAHLKLKKFLKLSDKILLKYAEAFNINLKELKEFDEREV